MDDTKNLGKILRSHYTYSKCMKKFQLEWEKDPSFVPSDISCIDKVQNHWFRTRQYCSTNNCFYRDSWKRDHQKFVKVLGHLKGKTIPSQLFDKENIF
ncbi:hypothetical protein ISTM_162 [Insectomime virus]|nr:hypothetical protein ISTM_162 [Insectomime virus]